MRSAIILLEDQAAKELALKPVLDRRVIDFNVNELKMANVENICLIANDLNLKINDVTIAEKLYDAISILPHDGDTLILDGVYPNLKSDTYEKLFANANSRIEKTQIIKLCIKDLVNIKNIQFDTVKVDEEELKQIKCQKDVYDMNQALKLAINTYHLNNGVNLFDLENTYIGPEVVIEKNATIYPNVHLEGHTVIKANATISANSYLKDAYIGENTTVLSSRITDSKVGNNVTCGPNSHLRMHTEVGDNVRIGNFVEFKNTKFGYKSRCAHLTYLGDSIVGEDVNIGCGVITANYDGKHKFQTVIGDHSFIGSNSNLIAPVKIGANVLVAAGSTITQDVEDGDMAIARAYQTNKKGRGYTYIHKEK